MVALQGATQQTGGYTWYSVRAVGVNGWIRGDMLRILTKEKPTTRRATPTRRHRQLSPA